MGERIINFLIILFFIFFIETELILAQDVSFLARDNAIFTTLNQIQDREEALRKMDVTFTPKENAMLVVLSQLEEREEIIKKEMETAKAKLNAAKKAKLEKVKGERGSSFRYLRAHSHPYLTVITAFDDNIDTNKEGKSDSSYNIKSGLKVGLPGRKRALNIDTYIDSKFYHGRPQGNLQDLYLDLYYYFNLGPYTFSFVNGYFNNYLSTPEMGIKMDGITFYQKNTFNSKLSRRFNRIGFDFGYIRTDYDYEEDANRGNRVEQSLIFSHYLRIARKTQLLFDYEYGHLKYVHTTNAASDYNSHKYTLGLSGALSSKLTDSLKIEYKTTDTKASQDERKTTFTGSLGYTISGRSDLAFGYNHIITETPSADSYLVSNEFSLGWNHRLAFNPKFKLSMDTGANYYEYSKYTSSPRDYARYTFGLSLAYAFRKWLDFDLGWTYTRRRGNFDIEYHNNDVSLKTQARF